MKKIVLILSVLAALSLACAALGFGGADGNNSPDVAGSNNMPSENTVLEEEPAADSGLFNTESPCYNPFYPLGEGMLYTYQTYYLDLGIETPDPSDIHTYELETVEETDETVTVQLRFSDVTSEVKWQCSEEGLFSSEYAQFDVQSLGDSVQIDTVSYEGVTLPTEEAWFVGNTWNMDYEINMSYQVQGMDVASHVVGALVNEIIAIEDVTVPVGTYSEAYKVETTGTITTDTIMPGTSVSNDIDLTMTSWYVKGVGMVKQISNDISGTSVTELIATE